MPQLATLKRQIRPPRPVKERRSKTARTLHERNCSVGRTVAILSDSWAFLVLRESYFGATRFEAFQLALGIPRQTLTQRLRMLTMQGLLHRVKYSERPKRSEYRLTDMGFDLYPVMLALLAFGNKWLCRSKKPPVELIHNACGAVCHPVVACSRCKEAVTSRTVSYREGPGAGVTRVRVGKRYRRSSDPAVLDRGRPSMVAETLKIIGDRWSFMVITEAFFGIRQFDQWQQKLGIASNILTDRLNRLVADGIFERRKYQDLPLRFEYRFTEKGKDLYGPLIAMLRWGDRWLSHGKPPLILTHHVCKQDFEATVICDHCRQPLYAQDMGYQLSYRPKHDERSKKPGRPAGRGRTRIIFPLCERSA